MRLVAPAAASGTVLTMGRTSRHRARRGFTIIEAAVVAVLTLALAAVTIPRFGGARTIASEDRARASLGAVVDAQMAVFNETGAFTTSGSALNPHLARTVPLAGSSTGPGYVSIDAASSPIRAGAAVLDAGGTCWMVRLEPSQTGRPTLWKFWDVPTANECTGARALNMSYPPDPFDGNQPRGPVESTDGT